MGLVLKREDIDPEKPGKYGQTALVLASAKGHEGSYNFLSR